MGVLVFWSVGVCKSSLVSTSTALLVETRLEEGSGLGRSIVEFMDTEQHKYVLFKESVRFLLLRLIEYTPLSSFGRMVVHFGRAVLPTTFLVREHPGVVPADFDGSYTETLGSDINQACFGTRGRSIGVEFELVCEVIDLHLPKRGKRARGGTDATGPA